MALGGKEYEVGERRTYDHFGRAAQRGLQRAADWVFGIWLGEMGLRVGIWTYGRIRTALLVTSIRPTVFLKEVMLFGWPTAMKLQTWPRRGFLT